MGVDSRKAGNSPVAENIERLIKENRLSSPKIARYAGMSPRNLRDIINGNKLVRASEIVIIAEALRVDVAELFHLEEDVDDGII